MYDKHPIFASHASDPPCSRLPAQAEQRGEAMKRLNLQRHRSDGHPVRRRMLTVGAFGAAAEGVRRWRHRRHTAE